MSHDIAKPPESCYDAAQEHGGGKGPILPPADTFTLTDEELKEELPGVNGPLLSLAVEVARRAFAKQGMGDPTEDEIVDLLREIWPDTLPALTRKVIERGEFQL